MSLKYEPSSEPLYIDLAVKHQRKVLRSGDVVVMARSARSAVCLCVRARERERVSERARVSERERERARERERE